MMGKAHTGGESIWKRIARALAPKAYEPVAEVDDSYKNNYRVGKEVKNFGRLTWKVLELDGDKALMITQDIIGKVPYDRSGQPDCRWENSCIRKTYLNGEFLDRFLPGEKDCIVPTVVKDYRAKKRISQNLQGAKNINTTTDSDFPTSEDRVFLLSCDEAQHYYPLNSEKIAEYRIAENENEPKPSCWWLRSSDKVLENKEDETPKQVDAVAVVDETGAIDFKTDIGAPRGVRPVLWVKIKKHHEYTQTKA